MIPRALKARSARKGQPRPVPGPGTHGGRPPAPALATCRPGGTVVRQPVDEVRSRPTWLRPPIAAREAVICVGGACWLGSSAPLSSASTLRVGQGTRGLAARSTTANWQRFTVEAKLPG